MFRSIDTRLEPQEVVKSVMGMGEVLKSGEMGCLIISELQLTEEEESLGWIDRESIITVPGFLQLSRKFGILKSKPHSKKLESMMKQYRKETEKYGYPVVGKMRDIVS